MRHPGHFEDAYGIEVSATFICQVTNAIMVETCTWQNRPLDAVYPILLRECHGVQKLRS
jgi:putative transposase